MKSLYIEIKIHLPSETKESSNIIESKFFFYILRGDPIVLFLPLYGRTEYIKRSEEL